jgi:hypothetical protein
MYRVDMENKALICCRIFQLHMASIVLIQVKMFSLPRIDGKTIVSTNWHISPHYMPNIPRGQWWVNIFQAHTLHILGHQGLQKTFQVSRELVVSTLLDSGDLSYTAACVCTQRYNFDLPH